MKRLLSACLLLGSLWTSTGCESTRPTPPALPETFAGVAFAPSSEVVAPILISPGYQSKRPQFPVREAFSRLATISYVVDVTGNVVAARIVSTNDPQHAQAVLRWLATARFVPGRTADHAVAVQVEGRFNQYYSPSDITLHDS